MKGRLRPTKHELVKRLLRAAKILDSAWEDLSRYSDETLLAQRISETSSKLKNRAASLRERS